MVEELSNRQLIIKRHYEKAKATKPGYLAKRNADSAEWRKRNPERVKELNRIGKERIKNNSDPEERKRKAREYYYHRKALVGHDEDFKLRHRLAAHRRRERLRNSGQAIVIGLDVIKQILQMHQYYTI